MPTDDDVYRVLCIGGSTTECLYLDDQETWPDLLGDRLAAVRGPESVWVGNVGISGFKARDHLEFAQTSELMNRVDLLVVLVGVNDLLSAVVTEAPEFARPPVAAEIAAPRPLIRRSRLLGLARRDFGRSDHGSVLVEDAAGQMYMLRRLDRAAAQIEDVLPDLEGALANYSGTVEEMIFVCRQRGVEPVFISQPVLWKSDLSAEAASLLWMGWLTDDRYVSAGCLREGMDRFNDELRAVCGRNGVGFVDASSMHGDESLFYDDCHYNEAGARALADVVGDWFSAGNHGRTALALR